MFLRRFLVTIVYYIFTVLTTEVLDSFLLVIIIECKRDMLKVFSFLSSYCRRLLVEKCPRDEFMIQ